MISIRERKSQMEKNLPKLALYLDNMNQVISNFDFEHIEGEGEGEGKGME